MPRPGDKRTAAEPQSGNTTSTAAPEQEEAPNDAPPEPPSGVCALPAYRTDGADDPDASAQDSSSPRWEVRVAQQRAWARHFACHDLLTGLPRRTVLMERLEASLGQAARRDRHVALVLVEVGQLETIRNRFGRPAGDAVLQQVAESLARSVRGADTVCRCSGDRFSVILADVESSAMATAVARRIREVLASLAPEANAGSGLDARIGVAVSDGHEEEATEMLHRAEAALEREGAGDG